MDERKALLRKAANGNEAAYLFLETLIDAYSVADDIQDEAPESWRVTKLLLLMTALPANHFYQQHAQGLRSLMLSSIIAWDLSNKVEQQRYAVQAEMIVSYVALLCGGEDLAKQVALEMAQRTWGL